MFYFLGDVNMSGTITATNCDSTVTHDDAYNRPLFYVQGGATKSITQTGEINTSAMTWTYGQSSACTLMVDDTPYTLDRVITRNATSTPNYATGRGLGCNLLITRSNAQGHINYAEGTNCGSHYGPAVYYSQGAGGTYGTFVGRNCAVQTGVVYWGGHGDIAGGPISVTGTTEFDASNPVTDSICFYSHVTDGASAAVTRSVGAFSFWDNYDDGSTPEAIIINNNSGGYDCDFTASNGISGELTEQWEFRSSPAGATLTITFNNMFYETSKLTDNTADTFTNNNHTNSTLTLNSDGTLPAGSAAIGGGTEWWTGAPPIGADGEPFPSWGIDAGAYQSQYNAFHPVNL